MGSPGTYPSMFTTLTLVGGSLALILVALFWVFNR